MSSALTATPTTSSSSKSSSVWLTYAVVGNPNSGKTTLFNTLTGLRQKVANYPGVTVEKKVGWCYSQHGKRIQLIDLPGAYSLSPRSRDESIARDVLLGLRPETPKPDRVICVVDACDLRRNLYMALQVIELGLPTIVVLTMMDLAEASGHQVSATKLEKALGVPVVACALREGRGLVDLKLAISVADLKPVSRRWAYDSKVEQAVADIHEKLETDWGYTHSWAEAETLLQLTDYGKEEIAHLEAKLPVDTAMLTEWQQKFQREGFDWRRSIVDTRYEFISKVLDDVLRLGEGKGKLVSDKIDGILTHPVLGLLFMGAAMALVFYTIFSLASYPMDLIDSGFKILSDWVGNILPDGDFKSLLTDGVIAGVGGVVIFLPQILLLFFFIAIMEESGYLARMALLLDRVMSKVGLHGRSFLPLLSGYACAIPGIMATRTIENERSRLITILVTPWMSCSARLPVYSLLIAAMIPDGPFSSVKKAGLMMAMYLLGTSFVFLFAWIFKTVLVKGEQPALVMELPAYRAPMFRAVLGLMWERAVLFLKKAGTVILAISIVLWFLTTYPKKEEVAGEVTAPATSESTVQNETATANVETVEKTGAGVEKEKEDPSKAREALAYSYAGRMGKWLEPAIAPLGFDWKIGIGVVTSFAAREVFVGTMSIIHNVGDDGEDNQQSLLNALHSDTREDGTPVFTVLTCLSLMVYYVFALQCLSTLPVIWRETNSLRWTLFTLGYMTGVAYVMSFLVYQGGKLLGFS
jgi:ferrous iron transport protein B